MAINNFTHKFVNAGVKGPLTPGLFAARKSIMATNRLGASVASIGNVANDIRKIRLESAANAILREQAERRRLQRERDQEAEEAAELNKDFEKGGDKSRKPTTGEKKKGNKWFGWLNSFLAPIIEFFAWLVKLTVIKSLLEWMGNPENKERLKTFLKNFTFVVKKLASFASWIVKDNILDGMAQLFGSGGKDGKDSFMDRVVGLGKLLFGFTLLRWFFNPLAMIGDIAGILDFILNWRVPNFRIKGLKRLWGKRLKKGWKAIKNSKRVKSIVNVARKLANPIIKPLKFFVKQGKLFRAGFKGGNTAADLARLTGRTFSHIATGGDKAKDMGKMFKAGEKTKSLLSRWFGKGSEGGGMLAKMNEWRKFTMGKAGDFGKLISGKWKGAVETVASGTRRMKKWLSNGWDYLASAPKKVQQAAFKRFVEPIAKKIKPFTSRMQKLGKGIKDLWAGTPIGKVVNKSAKKASKGLKGIPVIGGLVNLYFAIDSFKNVDTVGGVLESVAGILELGGAIATATGVGAALGGPMMILGGVIDAYLLSRIIPGGIGESVMNWERTKAVPALQAPFETAKSGADYVKNSLGEKIGQTFDGLNKFIKGEKDAEKTKHLTDKRNDGDGVPEGEWPGDVKGSGKDGSGTGGDGQPKKNWWQSFTSALSNKGPINTSRRKRSQGGNNQSWRTNKNKTPKVKKSYKWWDPRGWGSKGPMKGSRSRFGESGGKIPLAFIGKVFRGISRGISGIFKGIGSAIKGVIGGIQGIMNSPLGQILSFALPIMFPGAAWLGPVLKGLNAVSAFASGNYLGGIMSMAGAIGSIGTNAAGVVTAKSIMGTPNWMIRLRTSGFGNFMANLPTNVDKFLGSKMGKIGMGILQGNYGAAFNAAVDGTGLGAMLANFGNQIDSAGLGGILGSIPGLGPALQNIPGISDIVGIGQLVTGDFTPTGFIQNMADRHGLGGLYGAIMGMADGGDFNNGLRALAAELNVPQEVFGVVDTYAMLSEGGMSEKQSIQNAIGSLQILSIPVVIKQMVTAPTPIETGKSGGGSNPLSGLLSRLGF